MLCFVVFTSSYLRLGPSRSTTQVFMRTTQPSTSLASLSFQSFTTIKFCNSLVLITIQIAPGVRTSASLFASTAANLHLCFQQLPGCSSRNCFLFKPLHCCPGVDGSPIRTRTHTPFSPLGRGSVCYPSVTRTLANKRPFGLAASSASPASLLRLLLSFLPLIT